MDDDPIDTLMIDVRAGTQDFARDVAAMRATFDGTLVDGFARAGGVLERGLLGAIRHGSLGFDDLRRVALKAIDDIAAQAVRGLFAGGGLGSGVAPPLAAAAPAGGLLGGLVGAILGLPGRATGGPVAPERPYLVGERGPELFVPTSAGRVESAPSARPREVRVSIAVASPAGTSAPQALRRSARQVASAVRRALAAN
jgi:hypothetical protein